MIICVCEYVTEAQVIAEARTGATIDDIREKTGACSTCFQCCEAIQEILSDIQGPESK